MSKLNFKKTIILLLLAVDEKKLMSPIQIMKSLFLFKQKEKPQNFYDFFPYLYGPCSFDVYSDLKELISEGLIVEYRSFYSWNFYGITSKGEKALEKEFIEKKLKEKVEEIKKFILSKPFLELLKYIYSNYPEFAQNAIINPKTLEKL